MALILMLLVPGAVGLWLVTGGRALSASTARLVALVAASVGGVAAVAATVMRPVVDRAWIPDLGVRWHFEVDGISAPLIVLTAVIGVLVVAHSWAEQPWADSPSSGSAATYLGALLLVETGALAAFSARDAVLFFIAFEIVLVPMWVLISRYGDPHSAAKRADASARFILYTAIGSTLMLVGILLLVTKARTADFAALPAAAASLSPGQQMLIAVLLTLGLAVKVPVFPLHTWLPAAHTTAPTAGSVLLAAVLLKLGTYGLVRLPLASVPDGFTRIAPVLAIAGVIGILWGGLICLVERDLKRLIAFSSVAHMGFVVLGLASGTETGLQAALIGNIAHGVISALLFVIVGGLKHRWGSVDLAVLRPALREVSPRLGFGLILGLAAGLGLPGLAGFWGEFTALIAAWNPIQHTGVLRTCAVIAAVGAALAAAYSLRVARIVWVGDEVAADAPDRAPDARGVELGVISALAVGVVALGVAPHLVFSVTSDAVTTLIGGGR
ncbi:putative NADH dehydrogenase I chain M [Janibacter sp. HTCC2649]|uniref:complex I subunit 4 family protein n=1 Tax=Janibacter sp. HTCC2649 TaxID=313589 RepID=UPI0000670971|nr:NADH-quinone oxidoreductase subunit M [Janibacter sp. HTCC2649]EAQ00258.1 putative NADH dehydrogenase I chain M [Janibacter sp. HTCC2649]